METPSHAKVDWENLGGHDKFFDQKFHEGQKNFYENGVIPGETLILRV